MKNFYFLLTCFLFTIEITSQTVIWYSDCSDHKNFDKIDIDEDGNNWRIYNVSEENTPELLAKGFNPGIAFVSFSYDVENAIALTPDNVLVLPIDSVIFPEDADLMTFKMKVGALQDDIFEERFAIYVYDANEGVSYDYKIYEETLSSHIAKDISVAIPTTFAGKSIGLLIRHYNSTNQWGLLVDDFEVSYSKTLSYQEIEDLNSISFYPNPVKDLLNISSNNAYSKILISNQLGQEIKVFEKSDINDNTIDLSNFVKGVYFVNVESFEGQSQLLKILKQ